MSATTVRSFDCVPLPDVEQERPLLPGQHQTYDALLPAGPEGPVDARRAGPLWAAILPSVMQAHKLSVLDNDENAASVASLLSREGVKTDVRHPPESYVDVGEMPAAAVRGWLSG